MRAQSPTSTFRFPSPRQKPRLYKYFADDNPDLNKIVFDIIDGLNIDQIEPELYQELLPLLEERLVALQQWRNQPASRSLQTAIDFIKNYRYSDDPKQLRPRSERKANGYANCSIYTEDENENPDQYEINTNVDYALRGQFELIEPDLYSTVNGELNRIKNDALKVKDYQLAQQSANATRKLQTLGTENIFYEFTTQNLAERENHLFEKQVDYEKSKEEWDEIIKNAEIQREKILKDAQKQNENALLEFDKQYDLDPPSEIFKYSPQVLELRARESYLVKAGRYTEATDYNNEASALEQVERENHRRKWYEELDIKRAEFEKKLKEKYKVREDCANQYVANVKMKASKALEQNEKKIQHAEFNLDGATRMCSLGGGGVNSSSPTALNSTFNSTNSTTMRTLTNSSRPPTTPRSARNGSKNSRLPPLLFDSTNLQTSTKTCDTQQIDDSLLETAELAITSRRTEREAALKKTIRPVQTPAMRFRQKAIMNTIVYTKGNPHSNV